MMDATSEPRIDAHADTDADDNADARRGLFAPRRRALSIGTIALISMLAFEALAVAAAMPAVAKALDGLALYALAFGGMLATSMIGMVLAGADSDRRGPYRSMAFGLAAFGSGLLLAGLAPSMLWLVLGRVLQGLGSGMLGVALYVAMGRLLPAALRPRLFAAFAAAWVVPGIVGPGLAGLMVDALGWRSVFLLVAIVLLPCALMVLPPIARLPPPKAGLNVSQDPTPRASRLPWACVAAVGALWLHHASQSIAAASLASAAGVLLACTLVLLSARHLLPRGTLLGARGLPSVILLRGLLAAAFFCAEVFIPLWLTSQHGWTIAEAGLALSAGAVCWSLGSAIQARMEDVALRLVWLRRGLAMVGLAIAAISAVVFSGAHAAWLLPAWILTGLGIGIAFPMLSVLMLQLSPEHEQGANASALQLSDALVTACVLAVQGAAFAWLHPSQPVWAFASVFAAASGLALLGAALSGRCGTNRESTMG